MVNQIDSIGIESCSGGGGGDQILVRDGSHLE